jgi:hypothetical protein
MKIAVSGKGGVGKTTATALLAYGYAAQGYQVLAVDADPSPCLGEALGFPAALLAELHPIAEMEDLIAERTGAQPGSMGGYFRLNPRVEDIPERFSVMYRGIRLLQLGAVEKGGSGCICPESVLLRSLVTHILAHRCGPAGHVCGGGASGTRHGGCGRCDDHRGRTDGAQHRNGRTDSGPRGGPAFASPVPARIKSGGPGGP